jgi:hypothetical protein
MKIIFTEDIREVAQATEMSNQLLNEPEFYRQIESHQKFDDSNISPAVIAGLMKDSTLEFKIEIFHPQFLDAIKYRKTFAYTDGNFPNTLFLNAKKLDREVEDIAATIIHEAIHALDEELEDYNFGHGNNKAKGKDNTAPYWIGHLAYRMLTRKEPEFVG